MTKIKMTKIFDTYDHLPPLEAVVAAWTIPGRFRGYHAYMQAQLEREWPLLARALDRLVQENQQKEKNHGTA